MFKEAPRFIYSWKKVISSTSPSTLAHKDPRQVSGRTHQRNPCWGSPSHPWLRHERRRPAGMLWSSPMTRETGFPTSEELGSGV